MLSQKVGYEMLYHLMPVRLRHLARQRHQVDVWGEDPARKGGAAAKVRQVELPLAARPQPPQEARARASALPCMPPDHAVVPSRMLQRRVVGVSRRLPILWQREQHERARVKIEAQVRPHSGDLGRAWAP